MQLKFYVRCIRCNNKLKTVDFETLYEELYLFDKYKSTFNSIINSFIEDDIIFLINSENRPIKYGYYDNVINTINELNIPHNKIIFQDNDESKPEWKYNQLINYNSYPLFLRYTNIHNELHSRNIKYNFLFLNNIEKKHRNLLYEFMLKNDILKQSIFTYHKLDHSLLHPTSLNITSVYYETFCNIVTDTSFYIKDEFSHIINFNEKISKPIIAFQPFIVAAPPYYLKTLKEYGFKTFDKWWDESYDDIDDDASRLNSIKLLISKISKWDIDYCKYIYNEMLPTLRHNFEILKKVDAQYRKHLPNDMMIFYVNEDSKYRYEFL